MTKSIKKLKTGVIGCGKVGHFHAKALSELNNSEFVAAYGRNIDKVDKFAKKYNINGYTNIREMIEKESLDVVCICTPHPTHANLAIEAAEAGCNILIEKPLASSLEDCDRIIKAGIENDVTIGTLVQRRFFRPSIRMKKAIDDGKIGKPIIGQVNMFGWRSKEYYESDPWRGTWEDEGGGVLVNQAPHQIDLLLWYMGEVEEVYGIWKNFNHPYIEVDDTAIAVLKFKNGGIANILVSNSQNPALYGKVHIFGDNGSSIGIQTDGGEMFVAGVSEISEAPYNDLWTIKGEEGYLEEWKKEDSEYFNKNSESHFYHKLQIEDFLDSIIKGVKPMVTAEDGRRTVEIFEAIYRSTKDNKVIKLPIS